MSVEETDYRNYYGSHTDYTDGIRYRLDPADHIQKVVLTISGAVTDAYGRVQEEKHDPLMNELGVRRTRTFLEGCITKITHLSKFESIDRINRQARHFIRVWVFEVTRNRKVWDVKEKKMVVAIIEKTIYESMLRANQGFEAEITGKSWNVNQNIGLQPEQRQQETSGELLSGLFGRRK